MPGTYDAETDTVYYGTGNPGKDFVSAEREGDNLDTDSVLALDPKTGSLKWYRQKIRQDVWDFDLPYEIMLFRKDGKNLIVHLNKSGFVFVLDKANGNIENVWPISDLKNFVKDIDKETGELIGRVEHARTRCRQALDRPCRDRRRLSRRRAQRRQARPRRPRQDAVRRRGRDHAPRASRCA